MLDQEFGLIECQRHLIAFLDLVHDVAADAIVRFQAMQQAFLLEGLKELFFGRRGQADLVGDPAQECGIHDVLGQEIRGKDQHLIEGYREGPASVERQIVDPSLHRADPAVQKIVRPHQLPTEIVDDESAANGLHVQRCLVKPCVGIEVEVQHGEGQLAPRNGQGPPNGNPASVDIGSTQTLHRSTTAFGFVFILHGNVKRLVVEFNDLTVNVDAVRDVDDVFKQMADDLGNRRLAVARRTIEQDRAPGIDGRPQCADQAVRYDQIGEALHQRIAGNLLGGELLALDLPAEVVQRHRCRADIKRLRQGFGRPFPTFRGQAKAKFRTKAQARGPEYLSQIAILGFIKELIDDRQGELQLGRKLGARLQSAHIDGLQEQAQ